MFTNKYKYGLIDLSYLLNRNVFSCCRRYGIEGFTPGDVVRTIIQTLNKISRDHGITMDKCILLHDTWSRDYSGYYRSKLLRGQYKTSRVHVSQEEYDQMKSDATVTEKELQEAELSMFRDQIKKEAKKILKENVGFFGLPSVSVSGWEFDDLARLSSVILMSDPENKPSVIITKDSDLQYTLTPRLDYFKIPTANSIPETITYSEMWSKMPQELKEKGLSLYDYKSYVDSLGGGHNDMIRTKKPKISINKAISQILDGDLSSIANLDRFELQLKTFAIQDFPKFEEAQEKLMRVFLKEGQIRDYKDFKAFSDSVGVNTDESFISRNFYQEFTGRFDRKLYDNIL